MNRNHFLKKAQEIMKKLRKEKNKAEIPLLYTLCYLCELIKFVTDLNNPSTNPLKKLNDPFTELNTELSADDINCFLKVADKIGGKISDYICEEYL